VSGGGLAPTFLFEGRVRAVDAETLVRPVVEGAGLELVEVTLQRESGRRILRVTVDRDGGVDLDTLAELTERVSRRLDIEGFAPGPYALEVSSPGIERRVKDPGQFRRAIGQRIKVRTSAPLEGATSHTGELVFVDDDAIVIATAAGELRVRYVDVASARTVADWDAELKRSSR
jgi:ribosome maturation factor RimP